MDTKARTYLKEYLSTVASEIQDRYQIFDAYHFYSDEENANRCANLVLVGKKRAAASLFWSYETEDRLLPKVGMINVILNWAGIPQCVVETTAVDVKPFDQVDADFAVDEGEGDQTLDVWRQEHWKSFMIECKDLGREPALEMPIVLERFEVVYKGSWDERA